ncbi:MAG: PQQ-binding-like beta-propeller repeat protein [Victivallales bacterium]|nr:PQQ-binding-like beta-propeller repeat protein [Victivallales bacterium]
MRVPSCFLLALSLLPTVSVAAPHLGNVRRTGYTPAPLLPPYHLAWEYRVLQKPRPAWREPGWEPQRIDFDYALPVATGSGLACVVSSADHALRAFDARTGEPRWTFFAAGPIRLAPEIVGTRVYLGADDGFVYCLDAATGAELWRFRPGTPDERLLGNGQVISRWPARSGVLVQDNKVYTTFGMLSPEGIYVCCLDARDGSVIWINDTSGTRYTTRPHVTGMGGVSPQGYLVLSGDVLAVTCGRAPPALFDRTTGKLRYHEAEGDFTGGAWAMAVEQLIITPCESLQKEYGSKLRRGGKGTEAPPFPTATLVALDRQTGREVFSLIGGRRAVASDNGFLTLTGADGLRRVNLAAVKEAIGEETTIKHTVGHFVEAGKHQVWQAKDAGVVYSLLQAGETIIAGGRGVVSAFAATTGRRLWHAEVEGQVRNLCIGDGQLFASTTTGRVYCFAPGQGETRRHIPEPQPIADREKHRNAVRALLAGSGVSQGTCVVLGQAELSFLAELAGQSELTMNMPVAKGGLTPRRQALADAGIYGSRVALHHAVTTPLPYAQYLADLVIVRLASGTDLGAVPAAEAFRVLRPYGGVAEIRFPDTLRDSVGAWLDAGNVPANLRASTPGGLRITRGALAGAGEWTHQYADPGKSTASDERLARLPLKALWFGGPGPAKMVSRHFRAPAPLVTEGRCFISGTDHLLAMCIYTGRTLWERELPELAHWPSAYRGPATAADHEAVYALRRLECLRLDPATGKTLSTLHPPKADLADKALVWEYLAVSGPYVVGTLGHPKVLKKWWSRAYPDNRLLFALDKKSGKLIWQYRPRDGIDSNAIAISGSKVFVIDGLVRHRQLQRKPGTKADHPARLLRALDLASGKILWETTDVAPTHSSLWAKAGVVLSTIQPYSRAMEDPQVAKVNGGARAYAADTGKGLWQVAKLQKCSPVLVNGIAHLPAAHDLHTGKPVLDKDPLSGNDRAYVPAMRRACSVFSGSPSLIMSRGGSLGFYDLEQRDIVYHYPILRAGCWINMIPAGGLVVIPEGSSSCVCAYNYKASMALVHADRQHHYGTVRARGIKAATSLRLNLGAPGDRHDAEGRVWFGYPRPVAYGRPLCHARYGPKYGGVKKLPVTFLPKGAKPKTVSRYADALAAERDTIPWLDAAGVRLPVSLQLQLNTKRAPRYRVTMRLRSTSTETSQITVLCQASSVLDSIEVGPTTRVETFVVAAPTGKLTLECRSTTPSAILSGLEVSPARP